jgi:hypothetical protein
MALEAAFGALWTVECRHSKLVSNTAEMLLAGQSIIFVFLQQALCAGRYGIDWQVHLERAAPWQQCLKVSDERGGRAG